MMGFGPIAGGSGKYFLAVDRSPSGAVGGDGDMYYIANLTSDGVAFYFPDCDGTLPIEGMVVETSTISEGRTCTFKSRSSLMKAALDAERFLLTPHIVAVAPFVAFSKADPDDG